MLRGGILHVSAVIHGHVIIDHVISRLTRSARARVDPVIYIYAHNGDMWHGLAHSVWPHTCLLMGAISAITFKISEAMETHFLHGGVCISHS